MQKVIEFLKANNASDELIKTVESLKTINLDSVKEFLEKDETGKKFLQAQKDAAVTKGIETWKEKTFPKELEEEIKKRFPEETAEQKEVRELRARQQNLEAELHRKELLNIAINRATDKKLPIKLADKFLGEDEESTIANIDSFGEIYSEAINKAVESKFKDNGRNGGGGDGSGAGGEKTYKNFAEWKADNSD